VEKLNTFWNQSVGLAGNAILVAFFVFQLQAQDSCSSFGWANYDGQSENGAVSGGGSAAPIQVASFSALKSAVESSDAKVIYVLNDMGSGYKGTSGDVLKFKSNKTIIGVKPGLTIKCSFQISSANNIIVRNLIIRGPGNSNSEQNWDAVCIQGSKRIWFDHCTVMEGEDGNFDVVKGSDNVTVSWCKFTYVTGGEHNLSNLVGSSDDEPASHGKLNITYAYCWWDNVNSRCPRARYGKIHVLNCYYNNVGDAVFSGFMSNVRVEGCWFESNVKNPTGLISSGGQSGIFAIDCNRGSTKTDGYTAAFTPPYKYKKYSTAEVKSLVTNANSGAGPTLNNPAECVSVKIHSRMDEKMYSLFPILSIADDRIGANLILKQPSEIRMCVLDLSGRRITEMRHFCNSAGITNATLDLKDVQSGIYIFRLSTDDCLLTQKVFKNK
jgi:pectate lyase